MNLLQNFELHNFELAVIAHLRIISVHTFLTTEFAEIKQSNSDYAVQDHSRSPILVQIESSYDFLLVINTNLPPILHRFRDIAVDMSEIAIFCYPCCV